jgi:beta-carotene 3-hydroxylase
MLFFLSGLLIMALTFVVMEGIAWTAHKYLMHGPLWQLHEDHHLHDHDGFFEKNDSFFLIFAIPSWLFMMFGIMAGCDWRMWVGIGILIYGIAYFLVHEVFIHQRFRLWRNAENAYLKGIRRAHKMHHKHLGKKDGECFGMLWVPQRYFKKPEGIEL